MQLVVIDVTPQMRATLLGRVQEAARQAGLNRISVIEVDPLNLDSVQWGATIGIFLGVGCGSIIKELLGRISGVGGGAPLAIVLEAETYVGEAVAIHKVLGRTVVCETDLTQMANFVVDCERLASGRPTGIKSRQIVGVAQFKGGVGATTITVSMAACLARAGSTVAIIDLDDVSPQVTRWAKITPSQRMLTGDLLRAGEITTDRLRDVVIPVPGYEGKLAVFGQPLIYSEAFHLKASVLDQVPSSSVFMDSLLSLLAAEYDVVLIDFGRSWGIASFASLPWCERIVLVTDNDPLSLSHSVESLMRFMNESGDPDEFNLAKWMIALNRRTSGGITESDVVDSFKQVELLLRSPEVIPIAMSKQAANWGSSPRSFYDSAPLAVRSQIGALVSACVKHVSLSSTKSQSGKSSETSWFSNTLGALREWRARPHS